MQKKTRIRNFRSDHGRKRKCPCDNVSWLHCLIRFTLKKDGKNCMAL